MTSVIIIGGGLSGLAAAYELEQQGVTYTLIEKKARLGGGIITARRDGFVMDGGVFAFPRPDAWATLDELGMGDALFTVPTAQEKERVALKDGTQSLTDALAARLTNPVIKRMAVTSLGEDADGYLVCLENGLAVNARAVIVAAPARYAERMFRTLSPDVSDVLAGYHYDHVTRVALGYDAATKPQSPPVSPPDMVFAALHHTEHPARTPEGGLLVQAAVRLPLANTTPDGIVSFVTNTLGWGAPVTSYVHAWDESDPLTVTGPAEKLHDLNDRLPDGVGVVGGCYRPLTVPGRTEDARAVARKVVASLQS